jgi:adenine/guanine phosphoribosyltransferase-like PRPP-binding protein
MIPSPVTDQHWTADVAGWSVRLPIVAVSADLAIALMMVIDLGLDFLAHVGRELADRVRPLEPDLVVGSATLGIPIAIEVSRALGLDDYVILQKSPKLHLADAFAASITSITSEGAQRLLLDRRRVPLLAGKRVLLVDDVVASGSSLEGALKLLREAGADVVSIGVVLTEAFDWRQRLGGDADRIVRLGHIPQFRRHASDKWEPVRSTLLERA